LTKEATFFESRERNRFATENVIEIASSLENHLIFPSFLSFSVLPILHCFSNRNEFDGKSEEELDGGLLHGNGTGFGGLGAILGKFDGKVRVRNRVISRNLIL